MKLTEFISTIHTSSETLYEYPRIVFTGPVYPLLFFSYIATGLNKQKPGFVTIIDPDSLDESQIKAQLQTSFLGMQRMFWFGSITALESGAQKNWRRFLNEYNGPNTIMFYADEQTDLNGKVLEFKLPASCDKKFFPALIALAGSSASRATEEFTQSLFDRVQTVSFENACLLAQYAGLMGLKNDDFFDHWFDKLVVSDSSLFTLSQYFFAQDAKAFFAYWAKVHKSFGEPFWITFWSEQLFRAHAFVEYMRQNKRAEANRISYKLPFSFMQRDWKKYKAPFLKDAHNALYHIDYQFKNGGSPYALDLFYSKFFGEHSK
jgi:hypothetical protein